MEVFSDSITHMYSRCHADSHATSDWLWAHFWSQVAITALLAWIDSHEWKVAMGRPWRPMEDWNPIP